MKRKVAVFGNAWSEKNLSDTLDGVKKVAVEHDFDLFVFISHAAPGMSEDEQREEKRIYQLPDLGEFDGLIVLSSTMNFEHLVTDAAKRAREAGIPAISVGLKVEGMTYVQMGNMESMCQLVEHLVTEHGVKNAEFIAGTADNENSRTRIEAWRKVFQKHQLAAEDERIHYTDWSAHASMEATKKIIEKCAGNLPDALICANDYLAIAACKEVEKAGYRVPEDIIVTGYDHTYEGEIFYPSLCTVGQNDFLVGERAMELLMDRLKGSEVSDIVVANEFIKSESCGCTGANVDKLRIEECKRKYYDKLNTLEFGWSNSGLTNDILACDKPEQIKGAMGSYLKRTTMFENGTTYVLEDETAKHYFEGNKELTPGEGYSESLYVMAAVEKHVEIVADTISRRELIPGYKKKEKETKLYIFMPIHFKDRPFGYAVVEDWLVGISTGKIKIFEDSFNQTIDKLKQNIVLENLNERLRDLYTKDSLTGLYNRFGFNTEGVQIFEECKKQKKTMVLMFADVNRMKLINDYYGHIQGDMAIKSVAEVIKAQIPKDFIPIRFGGDEFLIVGECQSEEMIARIEKNITQGVRSVAVERKYPFYLSVSCGSLLFCPEDGHDLDSYIKEADAKMYEIKAHMHAKDPGLRAFVESCK